MSLHGSEKINALGFNPSISGRAPSAYPENFQSAEQNDIGILDLIFEKFAEVIEIHPAALDISYRYFCRK
jgi:hypothetical protein